MSIVDKILSGVTRVILKLLYGVKVSEWDLGNFSVLEQTLRMPYLLRSIIFLLLTRIVPLFLFYFFIFAFVLKISLIFSLFLASVLFLVSELIFLDKGFLKGIQNKHNKSFDSIKKNYKANQLNNTNIISLIEKSSKDSAYSICRFGYLAIPSWGWEVVFKSLYSILTSSKKDYRGLLIGFKNKSIEGDIKLWEVSQILDEGARNKELDEFLENYGNRSDGWDLKLPTLREHEDLIRSLLSLYKDSNSPQEKLDNAISKRLEAEKEVMEKLRVPVLLRKVQRNVSLREDRRFYEFEFDFFIRILLFKLAARIDLDVEDIFETSWRGIKKNARNN